MKALNRAISRTVSQIHRITTPDEYYPPLLDKLHEHLDALLEMERKQLEVSGIKFVSFGYGGAGGTGSTAYKVVGCGGSVAGDGTGEAASASFTWLRHGDDSEAQKADAIDMTNPANWQKGDVLLRIGEDWGSFKKGQEYRVMKINHARQEVYVGCENNWTGYTFVLLGSIFQWLRHGEAQQ